MLTVLPHGVCVDPETVKILNVRIDRTPGPNGVLTYTVVMKTDVDDAWIVVQSFDNRGEAEKLTAECARRINGEPDPSAPKEEEEAPAAAPPPKAAAKAAAAASDDDDW